MNKFVVKPATSKKKCAAKSSFNAKTGEMTLAYDFTNKNQLADFDVTDAKNVLLGMGF